jgi:hypothetical protein
LLWHNASRFDTAVTALYHRALAAPRHRWQRTIFIEKCGQEARFVIFAIKDDCKSTQEWFDD